MKIPKSVKIGWRNYSVNLLDGIRDENDELLD